MPRCSAVSCSTIPAATQLGRSVAGEEPSRRTARCGREAPLHSRAKRRRELYHGLRAPLAK
eukprot:1926434-Lingulodinium_polyedra.AAC.1